VGVARPNGKWGIVDKACACVLPRFFYAGGMMQPILLKKFIIIVAGMVVVGGAVFVGFRHASDVRGEITPKARHDIPYISAELTRLTLSAPT
jgi:hypothetical protein